MYSFIWSVFSQVNKDDHIQKVQLNNKQRL